ncbi:MAG: hypothetical protein R2710_24075 [Acidimicrobiales bacterium]
MSAAADQTHDPFDDLDALPAVDGNRPLRIVPPSPSVEDVVAGVTDFPAFAESQLAGGTVVLVGDLRDLIVRAATMRPDDVLAELDRIARYWRTTAALAAAAAERIGDQPWPDEAAS